MVAPVNDRAGGQVFYAWLPLIGLQHTTTATQLGTSGRRNIAHARPSNKLKPPSGGGVPDQTTFHDVDP